MSTTHAILLGCGFALLLTCYIIALVKSKRGEMVFTANGWDMAMLLACPVFFFLGWFKGVVPPYNTFQYVVFGLSAACFVGTMLFSIFTNMGSIWKILCSIFGKMFIIWLTLFVLLLILTILVAYIIIQLMKGREEEMVFLVKYDRFMRAFVGYRVV